MLGARRADRIETLANELTSAGYKALAVVTDVTKAEQVKNLVDTAVRQFGRIDVILKPFTGDLQRSIADLRSLKW